MNGSLLFGPFQNLMNVAECTMCLLANLAIAQMRDDRVLEEANYFSFLVMPEA
jgi:hypothetical protein